MKVSKTSIVIEPDEENGLRVARALSEYLSERPQGTHRLTYHTEARIKFRFALPETRVLLALEILLTLLRSVDLDSRRGCLDWSMVHEVTKKAGTSLKDIDTLILTEAKQRKSIKNGSEYGTLISTKCVWHIYMNDIFDIIHPPIIDRFGIIGHYPKTPHI